MSAGFLDTPIRKGMGLLCTASLLLCGAGVLEAQAPEALVRGPVGMTPDQYHELRVDAVQLDQQGDLEAAAAAYERLVQAYRWDSVNWWSLGYARYRLGEFRAAAEAFREADRLGVPAHARWLPGFAAMAYARAAEPDSALVWMERAIVDYRYETPQALLQDSALSQLSHDPRFQALAPPELDPGISRAEGWGADLDHLLAQIRRVNPEYSGGSLPDQLVDAAERLRERIPSLTDAQVAVEMQRLLAMLGQSHNNLLFPYAPGLSGRLAFTNLPLTFYQFPEGLYVIDAKAPHGDLIGARVLRFGSTATTDAMRAVQDLIARDSDSQIAWTAPTFLRIPEVLESLGVINGIERVPLTVVDRAGHTRSVELEPVALERRPKLFASRTPDAPEPPLHLRNVGEAHWFETMPEHRAVYVQFNQVRDEREESLAEFGLRLRAYLAQHPEVHNLIVDVRHNNGGSTYLYPELLRTMIAFDAREGNRLFALVGRNTFSAAENFAVDLDRLTNAIFVGEPTGGKPEAFGDSPSFVLPYSGLEGNVAAVVWNLSSPRDRRPWIAPDVPVALTAEEYFANRDPVMEAVVRLMERG